MGYFIVRYDDVNHLAKVGRDIEATIYLHRQEPFQKLWFAVSDDGVVAVHEHYGKPEDVKQACHDFELEPLFGDYEYIK